MSFNVYRAGPKKKSFLSSLSVNNSLILINVIFFFIFFTILLMNKENPEAIYNYFAIKPANILQGNYLWTFVTSMFLHGGFFHLFANMFSLFFIGSLVEKIIGGKRYFWFYLISGLVAGAFFVLASFVFPQDYNTFAVGASGALFALIGMLMFVTPNLPLIVFPIPIPIKLKYAAPGILVVLWLISVAGDIPIGNTAHLGGLLAGLGYGFYLKNKYKKKVRMLSKRFS